MNLNKFMKTTALMAMMALGVVGCNENPTDPPVGGNVGTASAVEATSLSSSSVGLRWTASTTAGATYMVSYRKVGTTGTTDSSSSSTAGTTITVNGTAATITGLGSGEYDFYVYAMSSGNMSNFATVRWAAATRFTQDANNAFPTLRMYEFASANGSGLILDPLKGGPRNASVAASSTDPIGSIALAIFTGVGVPADSFDVGPAYAFLGFRNANRFDSSAYVSRDAFTINSLNDLYLRNSLETYITASGSAAGNVSAFRLPVNSTNGVAFLMRVGNGTNINYARVLVKSVGGRLLQGAASNRYAEVEISYQTLKGVPYAKGVVRQETPATFRAFVPNPLSK